MNIKSIPESNAYFCRLTFLERLFKLWSTLLLRENFYVIVIQSVLYLSSKLNVILIKFVCVLKLLNEWMIDWMNEWMNEWMNKWMNDEMNKWMNEWWNKWLIECMNNWMNEIWLVYIPLFHKVSPNSSVGRALDFEFCFNFKLYCFKHNYEMF